LIADLRKIKEESENLDLSIFAKKLDVEGLKHNFTNLVEQTKLICDEKYLYKSE